MSIQEITATKWLAGLRSEIVLLVILAATAAVHLTSFHVGHNWGGDFSSYIHQAVALADGGVAKLQAMALFRIENSDPDVMVGPAFYPWGFPMLLSLLYGAFGLDLLPFRVLIVGFLVAAQGAVFLLLRGRLADVWVLLIVFVMGMNPAVFEIKNDVLSDVPFLFVVLLSLVLIEYLEGTNRRLSGSMMQYAALGALMFLAYFIRTHGVVLVGTLAVAQIMRRWPDGAGLSAAGFGRAIKGLGWAAVIPYGVFAVGFGGNALSVVGGDASYLASQSVALESIREWVSLVTYNVIYYAWLPSTFLGIGAVGKVLNVAVLLPLAVFGAYRRLGTDRVLVVFTVCYMAILIVWPFQLGVRTVLPVMPMYLYFGIVGAAGVQRYLAPRLAVARGGPSFAAVLFMALALAQAADVGGRWNDVRGPEGGVLEGPYTASSQALFAHIRENTPEAAVLTVWRPRVFMLFTGRQAVLNVAAPEILEGGSDYLVVFDGDYWDLAKNAPLQKVVAEYPGRFALDYSNADFRLYRIAPDDAG